MHLDKRGLVLSEIGRAMDYKSNLLLRLGGKEDLFAILTTLSIHLQNDVLLSKYYGAYKVEDLRLLMIDFFNSALLLIFPRGFDLKQHIAITQYHQLATGMGATEFDVLIQAFQDAFSAEPIPEEAVSEVIDYLRELRPYFGDERMQQRAKKIAASMETEAEDEVQVEIHVGSGHNNGNNNNNDATSKIRSWSRGRRKRNPSKESSLKRPSSKESALRAASPAVPEEGTSDIRRMPRRGSLQYRIKSVMPVRRISVPKENDKDPGPIINNNKSKNYLDHANSSLSSSQDGTSPKQRSDSKDSRQQQQQQQQQGSSELSMPKERKAPMGSFSFTNDGSEHAKPIRRMPRRGSLQYRIKSVMPVRRISVPKENDKDPGPSIILKSNNNNKEPSTMSIVHKTPDEEEASNEAVKTANDGGGIFPSFTKRNSRDLEPPPSFTTTKQQEEERIRMPRRGSLQYRIKSVLPVRRISVPKENDKDPGPILPTTLKSRPSLSKSADSKSSLSSNRGSSPHRRLFQAMRRMGSKDKNHLNNNYNNKDNYSSSDDEAFVSSEEISQGEYTKEKTSQELSSSRPTLTDTALQLDGSYKTKHHHHHDIPRRTKAYAEPAANNTTSTSNFGHAQLMKQSSWEKALVL